MGARAVAVISGADANVKGFVHFTPHISDASATCVQGRITGLRPGLHGIHIHAFGDTTNGCNSTGPHFNPLKKDHGSPLDEERHAGDLGNIVALPDGVADIFIIDNQIPLSGPNSILGRAVVVHTDPDDLGKGGHELSKTTGNAGARVGCGKCPTLFPPKRWLRFSADLRLSFCSFLFLGRFKLNSKLICTLSCILYIFFPFYGQKSSIQT